MSVKVRVSPVSRTAAVLIIAIGVFVLAVGLATGELASEVTGGAFLVLGAVLYYLLLRFTKRLQTAISQPAS